MDMEYSLGGNLMWVAVVGWKEGWTGKPVAWLLSLRVLFLEIFFFFFKLAPKNRSFKVSLVSFFSKLPQSKIFFLIAPKR